MDRHSLTKWIDELAKKNELWRFYKSNEWVKVKDEVLQEHHYECYECKQKGVITTKELDKNGDEKNITTVHHRFFVRKYPAFALSKVVTLQGKREVNLIPVCKSCHNKLHPEKNKNKFNNKEKNKKFFNEERW